MAAGAVRTTEAANFIPTVWSLEVIDAYYANFVFGQLLDRSYQELAKMGAGNKIRVPKISALSNWAAISQGSAVGLYEQVVESFIDIDVATYEGIRLQWPSIVEIQAISSLRQNYTREMGLEAAKAMDTSCAALVASVTQNVGTLAVDLTDDDILRAEQYLMDAKCPASEWFSVVSPAQLQGFRKVDKYANMLYKSAAGTIPADRVVGAIGPLYNHQVYQSTNIVVNGSGRDNVLFQKQWAALVVQQEPKVEMWRNVQLVCDEVVCWALWGVKQMRDTSAVWMKGL